ncbi:unnamed protein product [Rotaria sordida]|uniref:Translation initiation factor beta propellor-like domain-containing protein n=1 Tax=Rotaria sordida TaxID=392033 RepID=A0A819I9U7_9BILA|nr:unnamed protein product [Rotaria sordida]
MKFIFNKKKKTFKISSLADFQWSPMDNRLAYWTVEDGHVPACLVLAKIKDMKLEEIRSKTLFNVIDCKLNWQKHGDYLVVKVDRYTKKSEEKKIRNILILKYFISVKKNVLLDIFEVKVNHITEKTIQSFAVEARQGQKSEIPKIMIEPVMTAIWTSNG